MIDELQFLRDLEQKVQRLQRRIRDGYSGAPEMAEIKEVINQRIIKLLESKHPQRLKGGEMSRLNIELLKKLRRRFLRMRHPEHFQMDVIAVKTDCGSALCIAGHTLELAGYTRKLRPEELRTHVLDFDFISPEGRKIKNPLAAAGRELGLNYRLTSSNKAYRFFHDWSLETPEQAAERIQELIEGGK